MSFAVGDIFTTRYPGLTGPFKVLRIVAADTRSPILVSREGSFIARMCDIAEEKSSFIPEDWS